MNNQNVSIPRPTVAQVSGQIVKITKENKNAGKFVEGKSDANGQPIPKDAFWVTTVMLSQDASWFSNQTGEMVEKMNGVQVDFFGQKMVEVQNYEKGQIVTISYKISGRSYKKQMPDGTVKKGFFQSLTGVGIQPYVEPQAQAQTPPVNQAHAAVPTVVPTVQVSNPSQVQTNAHGITNIAGTQPLTTPQNNTATNIEDLEDDLPF